MAISRGRCWNNIHMNQILPYLRAEHSSSSTLKSDISDPKFKCPCIRTFSLKALAEEAFFECLYFPPLARAAMERQRLTMGGVQCVSRCVTAHAGYYREPNSKQLILGGAQRQIKQHVIPSWLAPPAWFRRGKGSSQSRGWSVCASSFSPPLSQGVSFHPELENSPGMWDEESARCVSVCGGTIASKWLKCSNEHESCSHYDHLSRRT